jgi:hypothetical protein
LESPISHRCKLSDICIYAPGDLNKIGKEGKTSWDSFSYALLMGHNVWLHINSVQEANRQYDQGIIPRMLIQERFDLVTFRQVVDEIFSTGDRGRAEALIEEHSKFWMAIPGSNGTTGKKTINSLTSYLNLFDEVKTTTTSVDLCRDDSGIDESKLDSLEMSI